MIRIRKDPPLELIKPIPGDRDNRCEADAVRINGVWTPGYCTISKAGIPYTWDKRKGYGYSGAWLVFTGTDLNEFDTTFKIVSDDQYQEWKTFNANNLAKPKVQPQNNGVFLPNVPKPRSLGIYNPILAELGIAAVVPVFIGQFVPGAGASRGTWTKTISWSVWNPPTPAIGKANQPIPDANKALTADDAIQLQIRAAQQRHDALAKALAQGHN